MEGQQSEENIVLHGQEREQGQEQYQEKQQAL